VELLDLFFATAKIGAVLAPLSHRLAGRELAAVLSDVDPALLAVETPFKWDVVDAIERADAEHRLRGVRVVEVDRVLVAGELGERVDRRRRDLYLV
jgi:fatty-acyl-CoA synthase